MASAKTSSPDSECVARPAQRSGHLAGLLRPAGHRRRHRRCVRPQIPGLSPVVWGLTSRPPVSPCGLSSGFPFARRVLPLRPPSSGFPSSGVLRFVPFGRCPGSGSPFGFPQVPFSSSNLHVSAAARRFRRRWSRTAGTNAISSAVTTPLDTGDLAPVAAVRGIKTSFPRTWPPWLMR